MRLLKYLFVSIFDFSGKNKLFSSESAELYRQPTEKIVERYVLPKIKMIKENIKINKDAKVLDVGCGNGTFSYYLEKEWKNLICIDPSEELIAKNPCKNKFLNDVYSIPSPRKHFDLVFEANVLHHVDDLIWALKEMTATSKKYIVIIEPNMWNPPMLIFSAITRGNFRAVFLTINKIRKIIERSNFKITKVIKTGMIFQNTTPDFLLDAMRIFDGNFFFGAYKIIICERRSK